ncbi:MULTISPECIES: hypothetical protein [Elizabethkingia]|uniref:hypothetical protein n=1 Tax=Elizabethkingia TaxID=308865 RepID=UPI00077E9D4B|nr:MULTISPECIES: hypothetical protein [Elizabethkingia]AMR41699.1 hypothetical protein A2T74_10200 [Elizabethkingia anophelis]AMX48339.1 hypothetical protein A4C56_10200 [Elizabethkingia anophelis]AMX51797.1 hypothetical protein A2T72_10200 [Elizabethkingia anophelis]AMX55187.1 hypothetical protein A2T59_10200 [Elizabethkingia anophelis]EGT4348248.1 hypothetical protein [Elizabethkingia anophelis]
MKKTLFIILMALLVSCETERAAMTEISSETKSSQFSSLSPNLLKANSLGINSNYPNGQIILVIFPTAACDGEYGRGYEYSAYVTSNTTVPYERIVYSQIIDYSSQSIYAVPIFRIPANEHVSSQAQNVFVGLSINSSNISPIVRRVDINNEPQSGYEFLDIRTAITTCPETSWGKDPCQSLTVKDCLKKYNQHLYEFLYEQPKPKPEPEAKNLGK